MILWVLENNILTVGITVNLHQFHIIFDIKIIIYILNKKSWDNI